MSVPEFKIKNPNGVTEVHETHNVEEVVKMVYSGDWVLLATAAEKKSVPKPNPDGPVMFVLGRVAGIPSYRRKRGESDTSLTPKETKERVKSNQAGGKDDSASGRICPFRSIGKTKLVECHQDCMLYEMCHAFTQDFTIQSLSI